MKTAILALTLALTTLNAHAFCSLSKPVELPSLENGPVVAKSFETGTPGESKDLKLVFTYVEGGHGPKRDLDAIAVRIVGKKARFGLLSEYPENVEVESEIVPYGTGFERHTVFADEVWNHQESSHLVFKDGKINRINIMSVVNETRDICIKSIEF